MPALYSALLPDFLDINPDELLGRLTSGLAKEGFDTTPATTFSWQSQIADLQCSMQLLESFLPAAGQWQILFEYVLPIIGQRLDCVLLANDAIFVIEYKDGSSKGARAALQQAQNYALNLADFHEASRSRVVIPIAVGAFRTTILLDKESHHQGAAVTPLDLPGVVLRGYQLWGNRNTPVDAIAWNLSRYFPVPTIIEAASSVYQNHDVKNLAYSRAGVDNLEITQDAVAAAVKDARRHGHKLLLVITGVPGAGKTLAGLNAVQRLAQELDLDVEQTSFLSGNGPLVAVIQEALKRSIGPAKKGVARSVRSRVREVHRFVKDSYDDNRPPADRLIIFDEAQRAWTAARNLKKFARDASEPEMILEIMGRHQGWAVVVALVGGGQEIHGGEAGLAAWGEAVAKHPEWEVITSHEALDGGASVAGSRLFRDGIQLPNVRTDSALHLAISKRSHQTTATAAWVNAVLDGRVEDARGHAGRELPVYLTRDLTTVRSWLRRGITGSRRVGLIASSGAARLRAEGVEAPTFDFCRGIDFVKWFLEPAGDHRSSNQLEVSLSEFELQGLEIDFAGLLWGGDLIFPDGNVVTRRLSGTAWQMVHGSGDPQASAEDRRTRIQNKYRVLLTRFRRAMVIFVPICSPDDATRACEDFDTVAEYLARCGVQPLVHDPGLELSSQFARTTAASATD